MVGLLGQQRQAGQQAGAKLAARQNAMTVKPVAPAPAAAAPAATQAATRVAGVPQSKSSEMMKARMPTTHTAMEKAAPRTVTARPPIATAPKGSPLVAHAVNRPVAEAAMNRQLTANAAAATQAAARPAAPAPAPGVSAGPVAVNPAAVAARDAQAAAWQLEKTAPPPAAPLPAAAPAAPAAATPPVAPAVVPGMPPEYLANVAAMQAQMPPQAAAAMDARIAAAEAAARTQRPGWSMAPVAQERKAAVGGARGAAVGHPREMKTMPGRATAPGSPLSDPRMAVGRPAQMDPRMAQMQAQMQMQQMQAMEARLRAAEAAAGRRPPQAAPVMRRP